MRLWAVRPAARQSPYERLQFRLRDATWLKPGPSGPLQPRDRFWDSRLASTSADERKRHFRGIRWRYLDRYARRIGTSAENGQLLANQALARPSPLFDVMYPPPSRAQSKYLRGVNRAFKPILNGPAYSVSGRSAARVRLCWSSVERDSGRCLSSMRGPERKDSLRDSARPIETSMLLHHQRKPHLRSHPG